MKPVRQLSLYHRRGCHLCDEMLEELERRVAGLNVVVEMVDIDQDPSLTARFGHDIPVLMAGSDEICRHRLDPGQLNGWLSAD